MRIRTSKSRQSHDRPSRTSPATTSPPHTCVRVVDWPPILISVANERDEKTLARSRVKVSESKPEADASCTKQTNKRFQKRSYYHICQRSTAPLVVCSYLRSPYYNRKHLFGGKKINENFLFQFPEKNRDAIYRMHLFWGKKSKMCQHCTIPFFGNFPENKTTNRLHLFFGKKIEEALYCAITFSGNVLEAKTTH